MSTKNEPKPCRLGDEVLYEADPTNDFDEAGRDMRCAWCRGEACVICGTEGEADDIFDCEHDTDTRHGWAQ